MRYVIFHGDAKYALRCLKTGSVDLVFTSPPYFDMRGEIQWGSYYKYISEMEQVMMEVRRVLRIGRIVVINISDYIADGIRYDLVWEWHRILKDCGFVYRDWIIWEKPNELYVSSGAGRMSGNFIKYRLPMYYSPDRVHEVLLVFSNGNMRIPTVRDEENSKVKIEREFLRSVWHIASRQDPEHPAVFPHKLAELVISYYSFYGETVLDPFLGSGTTMEVARKLGRNCIGCEINEKYVKIAKERVGFGQTVLEGDVEYEVVKCI